MTVAPGDGDSAREAAARAGGGAVPRALRQVRDVLESGVGRAYPGAVLAVAHRGETVIRWAVGLRSLTPTPQPARPDTIYDLASLTKVVATTPLMLQAHAVGHLKLDDPLAAHLPDVQSPAITLRHLLAHTAGLPAWIPFYLDAHGYEAVVARAAATVAGAAAPGSQVVYSDVGFILLGEVLRRAFGAPLDAVAKHRLFDPVGMRTTAYRPDRNLRGRIAPTEDGTEIERSMAGDAGRRHTWRRYLIWGEVHDSNAHAMGGVSGHAGLFGTADDLIAYARLWLQGGRAAHGEVLRGDLVSAALTAQPPDRTRGLGWALSGPQGWWGDALSGAAFGHTGFTGTSLVADPERDLAMVLLTNAIHLGRDRTEILALRPQLAGAVARALR